MGRMAIGEPYDGTEPRYYLTLRRRDGSWESTDRVWHYDRAEAERVAAAYAQECPDSGMERVLTPVPAGELEPFRWQVEQKDGIWRLAQRNAARTLAVWLPSSAGYASREEAEQGLAGLLYEDEHTAALPSTLSRSEYEERAQAAELEPVDDDAIRRASYGLTYFHISLVDDRSGVAVVDHRLRRARLRGIEDEERPARVAALRAERERLEAMHPLRACPLCGELTRELLGSSIHGAVCPDCYDRVEQEA